MPREYMHWHVLDETCALLQRDAPRLASIIESHRDAAELGAMAHDAPYFLERGHSPFSAVATYLHGADGGDTFAPLRNVGALIGGLGDPAARRCAWAFLAGMVTHAATDIAFHPLVYYFTGNYEDPDPQFRQAARTRHRLFETYLDLHAERIGDAPTAGLLAKRVTALAAPTVSGQSVLRMCCGLLGAGIAPPDFPLPATGRAAYWESAITEMGGAQRLFHSALAGLAVRIAKLVAPPLDQLDALFSFARADPAPVFSAQLTFRNPANGIERTAALPELAQSATASGRDILCRFEQVLDEDGNAIERALADVRGASLNIGLAGVSTRGLKFFSPDGFPLPGLGGPVRFTGETNT